MALSALDDASTTPTVEHVADVVGKSFHVWTSLYEWLGSSAGVDRWEWGFSGKKYGWALRAKHGKRTIAYLIPQVDAFLVGLVLGDRAMEVVRNLDLSAPVTEVVTSARRYGEGTGFRIPVVDVDRLKDVKLLIEAKVAR